MAGVRNPIRAALAAGGALVGGALWWRRNPSPCPYSQRAFVDLPHPIITRGRLLDVLAPEPGERLLEVGPGTGYYTLDVAERLLPGGRLDLLDVQREMLDHTLDRARARGLEHVHTTLADAQDMPYPDGTFAGAFLVTVLGEVPDQRAALRELARVVRPDGRIVVGEIALDPHVVLQGTLRERAGEAGLRVERVSGLPLAYFARLVAAG